MLLRDRDRLNAEDALLLEDIVAEAYHMSALTNNMLTLARLDARTLHREYDIIKLDEVAARVVRRAKLQ